MSRTLFGVHSMRVTIAGTTIENRFVEFYKNEISIPTKSFNEIKASIISRRNENKKCYHAKSTIKLKHFLKRRLRK